MLTTVKGIIQGNTVIFDDDMTKYDSAEVIVTVLNNPSKNRGFANKRRNVSQEATSEKKSIIEGALLGAVPYTDMSLSELREERLRKYENIDGYECNIRCSFKTGSVLCIVF